MERLEPHRRRGKCCFQQLLQGLRRSRGGGSWSLTLFFCCCGSAKIPKTGKCRRKSLPHDEVQTRSLELGFEAGLVVHQTCNQGEEHGGCQGDTLRQALGRGVREAYEKLFSDCGKQRLCCDSTNRCSPRVVGVWRLVPLVTFFVMNELSVKWFSKFKRFKMNEGWFVMFSMWKLF